MELLAAAGAFLGGLAAGAAIRESAWPTLGRLAMAALVVGAVFFIGTRLGAAVVMDQAAPSLGAQVGSAFLAVMAGATWGVLGALLSLGGMLAGWLLAARRAGRE